MSCRVASALCAARSLLALVLVAFGVVVVVAPLACSGHRYASIDRGGSCNGHCDDGLECVAARTAARSRVQWGVCQLRRGRCVEDRDCITPATCWGARPGSPGTCEVGAAPTPR